MGVCSCLIDNLFAARQGLVGKHHLENAWKKNNVLFYWQCAGADHMEKKKVGGWIFSKEKGESSKWSNKVGEINNRFIKNNKNAYLSISLLIMSARHINLCGKKNGEKKTMGKKRERQRQNILLNDSFFMQTRSCLSSKVKLLFFGKIGTRARHKGHLLWSETGK